MTNTQPPGEQMLTDAEVGAIHADMRQHSTYNFARAVESAVLAKVAAQQREPVAYRARFDNDPWRYQDAPIDGFYLGDDEQCQALYLTSPPTVPVKADKPHPQCDEACMHVCTQGGTVSPECEAQGSEPKDGASLMRSHLLQLLGKASFSHQGDAYTANNLVNGLAALAASMNAWRRAIDEALVVSCLDCTSESESAGEALARLVQWEIQTALDPKVSEEAAALVKRGADAVQGEPSAQFDNAVAQELLRVSHLPYDSHEICKHFAAQLRARLFIAEQS